MQQHRSGAKLLESSSTEKELGVLLPGLVVEKASCILGCLSKSMGSRSGGVIGACETTSGVLCPLWSSPGENKEQLIGANPVEAHQDGQGLGAHDVRGEADGPGSVQP